MQRRIPSQPSFCHSTATRVCVVVAALVPASMQMGAAPPLASRVSHTNRAAYTRQRSHNGAGAMACEVLVPPSALDVNLNFVHRCQILPHSGVGHHIHRTNEELYVIFDGEAEFTVDGHTSLLQSRSAVPCRLGHSHAIYNPTDKPVEFMNINVAMMKGRYDATDLNDARVDAVMNAEPEFLTVRLDRSLLKPVQKLDGGEGTAFYRRMIGGDVFKTDWAYVDHLLLPRGASQGVGASGTVEEIYYVVEGEGQVRINDQTASIHAGDAIPIRVDEQHSFAATGPSGLELMIVGVGLERAGGEKARVQAAQRAAAR